MDVAMLQQNWGLVAAVALLVAVAGFLAIVLYKRSAVGQLRRTLRTLRAAERELDKARRRLTRSERKLRSLQEDSANVKPRLIDEARGAHDDAGALLRIANDQWMVAANHVRRVILEEYPPHRHEALRRRYLPEDGPDGRPFTF